MKKGAGDLLYEFIESKNVLFMSALMEYGVIDELFNLLYSYDEMTLEVVVIIMRKILEEFLENSENRNMILQKIRRI